MVQHDGERQRRVRSRRLMPVGRSFRAADALEGRSEYVIRSPGDWIGHAARQMRPRIALSGAPVARRAIRSPGAPARRARRAGQNRRPVIGARLPGGRVYRACRGQAGAHRFVDGQIGEVNAATAAPEPTARQSAGDRMSSLPLRRTAPPRSCRARSRTERFPSFRSVLARTLRQASPASRSRFSAQSRRSERRWGLPRTGWRSFLQPFPAKQKANRQPH